MKKKIISTVLCASILFSLCACSKTETSSNGSSVSETTAEDSGETEETEETEAEATVYSMGDSIVTDMFAITPRMTGYAMELANWPDENFMTPAGNINKSPYCAHEEKVMIYGDMDIEYTGSEK